MEQRIENVFTKHPFVASYESRFTSRLKFIEQKVFKFYLISVIFLFETKFCVSSLYIYIPFDKLDALNSTE